MERTLDLLERKNQYLEKFLLIGEAELLNFEVGDFKNLESFYECREKILNIIRRIEKQIEKSSSEFSDQRNIDQRHAARARGQLELKDQIVNEILDLDLRLISCIEAAKSSIIKELRMVKKGKKALSGYKSELGPQYAFNEEV